MAEKRIIHPNLFVAQQGTILIIKDVSNFRMFFIAGC